MTISCPYPECSKSIEIDLSHAGKVITCPACEKSFQSVSVADFVAATRQLRNEQPACPPTNKCAKCGGRTRDLYPYAFFGKADNISQPTALDGRINATLIKCDGWVFVNAFDHICRSCIAKRRAGNTFTAILNAAVSFAVVVALSFGIIALSKSAALDAGTTKIAFAIVWLGGLSFCWGILKGGWVDPGSRMALDANTERIAQRGYPNCLTSHLSTDDVTTLAAQDSSQAEKQ